MLEWKRGEVAQSVHQTHTGGNLRNRGWDELTSWAWLRFNPINFVQLKGWRVKRILARLYQVRRHTSWRGRKTVCHGLVDLARRLVRVVGQYSAKVAHLAADFEQGNCFPDKTMTNDNKHCLAVVDPVGLDWGHDTRGKVVSWRDQQAWQIKKLVCLGYRVPLKKVLVDYVGSWILL